MQDFEVLDAILEELDRARLIHPKFPTDPVRMVAKFIEEALESQQSVNNWEEGSGTLDDVKRELTHSGAMVVRCLVAMGG